MTDDAVAMGKRVRLIREGQGRTLRELADLAGMSVSYLQTIETGKSPRIGAKKLDQLALALNVHVKWLLTGEAPAELEPEERGFIEQFTAAPPKMRRLVRRIAAILMEPENV